MVPVLQHSSKTLSISCVCSLSLSLSLAWFIFQTKNKKYDKNSFSCFLFVVLIFLCKELRDGIVNSLQGERIVISFNNEKYVIPQAKRNKHGCMLDA